MRLQANETKTYWSSGRLSQRTASRLNWWTTTQKTNAGGDLGRFTSEVRLLDNDAYYVQTGFEGCNLADVCDIG